MKAFFKLNNLVALLLLFIIVAVIDTDLVKALGGSQWWQYFANFCCICIVLPVALAISDVAKAAHINNPQDCNR